MHHRIAVAAILIALVPLGIVAWHHPLATAAITAIMLAVTAVATVVATEREGSPHHD